MEDGKIRSLNFLSDLSLRFTFLLLSRDDLFVLILSQIGDGESPCHPNELTVFIL